MGIHYKPENFKRLILKISGEFLAGEAGFGYSDSILRQLTDDLIEVINLGYEIGIVIGGGNIVRGKQLDTIDQTSADNVGMLATIQNAIVVSEYLRQRDIQTEVYSAFPIPKIANFYTFQSALKAMSKKKICFLAGGTGNPFFTTDTAAILRAIELKSDLVLKGTNVDGVFDADPNKVDSAKLFSEISYSEALSKQLKVMDMTAFSLARDYKIPIKVFNICEKGNLQKAILAKEIGTYVYE
jgi:uridylate kinase